jgi:hypothetical protein
VSVPNLKAPPGTPRFQADGHSVEEDSAYAQVGYAQGHSRARRRWTSTQRVVTVSWFLSAQKLQAIDDWYENALKSGERQFAAEVKKEGAGTLWWTARWISYQCEMKTGNRGRISGSILLTGTPQATAPAGIDLGMSVGVALLDIRSSIVLPADMSMTVSVALNQPLPMAMSLSVPLLSIDGAAVPETIVLRDEFTGTGNIADHTSDEALGDVEPWDVIGGSPSIAEVSGGKLRLDIESSAHKTFLGTFAALDDFTKVEFQLSFTESGDGAGGFVLDWGTGLANYVLLVVGRISGVDSMSLTVNGNVTTTTGVAFQNLPVRLDFKSGEQHVYVNNSIVSALSQTEVLDPFAGVSGGAEGPDLSIYATNAWDPLPSPSPAQITEYERFEIKITGT